MSRSCGARLMREAAAASPELLVEVELLESLAEESDVRVAAKKLHADVHRKMQRRGS